MNYNALIEARKSVRSFTDRRVPLELIQAVRSHYNTAVSRLIPEIGTELLLFGSESGFALEGAAGYKQFLIGAPEYLVLLTQPHDRAHLNAGWIMEDLILKLTELDLDSCWLTFTDSEDIKNSLGIESDLEVAAIAAFGYGEKAPKRLRINIRSMSNVDISAKRHYFEPKRSIYDLVHVNSWNSRDRLNDVIGFFDDALWNAFRAASLAPSYLNRQAYGFILSGNRVHLIHRPDDYTTKLDGDLSLGVVMHHFSKVLENWTGSVAWTFGGDDTGLNLPGGHRLIATALA